MTPCVPGPGGVKGLRGEPGPPGESSVIEVEGGGRRRVVHKVDNNWNIAIHCTALQGSAYLVEFCANIDANHT